jgi:Omp85 superfamily domain
MCALTVVRCDAACFAGALLAGGLLAGALPATAPSQQPTDTTRSAPPAKPSTSPSVRPPPFDVTLPTADVDEPEAGEADRPSVSPKRVTPLIAPIPGYNPQYGGTLAVALGAIHRFDMDTTVKPSTGMLVGLATTNGSWGVMGLEMARLQRDAWRLGILGGYFRLQYDFYGVGTDAGAQGISLPVVQPMGFGLGQVLRRVSPALYVGLRGVYSHVDFRPDTNAIPVELRPYVQGRSYTSVALAPVVQYDSRNDQYFPTRGTLVDAMARLFSPTIGSDSAYQGYTLRASSYRGLGGGRDVLAIGLTGCLMAGEVPVPGLCMIGGQDRLRGYEPGRYRDRFLLGSQAEYRHPFGRFGATAFVGASTVAPRASALTWGDVLPAGGVGLRYRLTKAYAMHYRVDVAYGKDGWQYYVALNEAF